MSTFTWKTLINGGWAIPANWDSVPAGAVPNDATAVAILPGAASAYTVTIAGGESEIVNTVTLGDLIVGDAGPTFDVAGRSHSPAAAPPSPSSPAQSRSKAAVSSPGKASWATHRA